MRDKDILKMLNIRFIKEKYTKGLAETLGELPIRNAHRVKQIDSFIFM